MSTRTGELPAETDRALVAACVEEAAGAWDRLVSRYASLILAVARRTLRGRGARPSDEDLEDIVENAFWALIRDDYRVLRGYDPQYALSTYLGVIARTYAIRFVRRKRHPQTSLDGFELPDLSSDPVAEVSREEMRRAVRDTLCELAPRDEAVLRLFYFSNLDYRGIARELGCSPNSVGAALHRARTRLKRRLGWR